jgi:hypothetical protein
MVFLPNLSVNLRTCLCGVVTYASAQALDFLDLGQKSAFLDWKHQKVPFFFNGLLWTATRYLKRHGVYSGKKLVRESILRDALRDAQVLSQFRWHGSLDLQILYTFVQGNGRPNTG